MKSKPSISIGRKFFKIFSPIGFGTGASFIARATSSLSCWDYIYNSLCYLQFHQLKIYNILSVDSVLYILVLRKALSPVILICILKRSPHS